MLPTVKNRTFMFEFIRLNLLLFDTKQQLIRLCTEYLATESEETDQREQHDKTINSCTSECNVDLAIKPEVEIQGTLVKSEIFNDLAKVCTQSNNKEFQGKDFTDDFDGCELKVEVDTERDREIKDIMANSEFNDFPVQRYTMSDSTDTSNTIQRKNHQSCNKPLLPIGILRSPTHNDDQDPAYMNDSTKLEEYRETEVCQSLSSFSEHESALATYILSEDSDCYKTLLEMGLSTTRIIQQQDTISTEDPHHSGFETILSGDSFPFPNLNKNKVLRRKKSKNHCYFCEGEVLNFARHVYRHHSTEGKVQEILAIPASSRKRRELLTDLRKQGNFKKLKPVRKTLGKKYVPCPHCLGLYSKKFVSRHTKTCTRNIAKTSGKSQVEGQNVLVKNLTIDPLLREFVFPRMRADKISLVAKNDKLICSFAVRYIKLHRKKHLVSQKMRELAKVLIFVQKTQEGITALFQALKPQFYDLLVEATKDVAKYDVDQEYYKSPTFGINFGTTLKQCCEIALNNVLKRKIVYGTNVTLKAEDDIKKLMQLISEKWRFDVSCQDLSINKGNKVTLIHNDGNINDNRNNNINKNNVIKKQNCKTRKGKRRVLVPWTERQKKLVSAFFEKHIEAKRPPKQKECDELRGLYPDILHNKDWLKIKVFVQNKYSKQSSLSVDTKIK